jgi:rfaE bifunctional protein nucleotidyltransferase chain/domain
MVITSNELAGVHEKHQDKKIVLTSGTFDLFHTGHLHYLEAVKAHGDILVVLLSGDVRVKARKGDTRPIIPEADRAEILDALRIVDYVLIDPNAGEGSSAPFYMDLVRDLQPACYVTDGYDVRFSEALDRAKQIILDRTDGGEHSSTSAIIAHIQSLSA